MNYNELREICQRSQWWALPVEFGFEHDEYEPRPPDFTSIVHYLNQEGWTCYSERIYATRSVRISFRHGNPASLAQRILERHGIAQSARAGPPSRILRDFYNTSLGSPFLSEGVDWQATMKSDLANALAQARHNAALSTAPPTGTDSETIVRAMSRVSSAAADSGVDAQDALYAAAALAFNPNRPAPKTVQPPPPPVKPAPLPLRVTHRHLDLP